MNIPLDKPIADYTVGELCEISLWLNQRIAGKPTYSGSLDDETCREAVSKEVDALKKEVLEGWIEWQRPLAKLMIALLRDRGTTVIDSVLGYVSRGGLENSEYGGMVALREYIRLLKSIGQVNAGQIVELLTGFYTKLDSELRKCGYDLG